MFNAAASDTILIPTHSLNGRSTQLNSFSLFHKTPSGQCNVERVTCIPMPDKQALDGQKIPDRLSIGTLDSHALPILPTLSGTISHGSDTVDRASPQSRNLVKHSQDNSDDGSEGMTIPPRPNEEPAVTTPSPWYIRTLVTVFTMYGELSVANTPKEFALVHTKLQKEWAFDGSFLVGLSAVNAAIFAITSDSIFKVNSYARTAVAISSATCGLGIACDAWLLLRYGWVDLRTFTDRSRDVYNLYAFFSLSSRMPTFCALISSISLMSFLGLTAYDARPVVVLVIGVLVILVMVLQFIVYGAHHCATFALRFLRAGVVRVSNSEV